MPKEADVFSVVEMTSSDRQRFEADQMQVQLRRLEERLLAEFGGNPDADHAVHEQFAAARADFADVRVQRYLPVLVERAARRRLRG